MKKKKKKSKNTKKWLLKEEKRLRNKLDKQWALDVKERDKHCLICNSTNFLNAHHIIPREIKKTRHNLDNGLTLCRLHHKFSLEISAHRNPFVLYLWLMMNRKEQIGRLVGGNF